MFVQKSCLLYNRQTMCFSRITRIRLSALQLQHVPFVSAEIWNILCWNLLVFSAELSRCAATKLRAVSMNIVAWFCGCGTGNAFSHQSFSRSQ